MRTGRDVARVLRGFERRWAAGHRAARVHPWERTRILEGDYGAIVRDLEPGFEKGQKFVLSQSRPHGAVVVDQATGKEMVYPKPPPQSLFEIEVRDCVRHRAGYWRVRFHVLDRRYRSRLPRRLPPARNPDWDRHQGMPPAQDEIDQASEEGNYTSDPTVALDHLDGVHREYQNTLVVQAKERFAEHRRAAQSDEETARDLQRINAEMRELAKRAAKMGVDPMLALAPVARAIQAQHRDLSNAA